MSTVTDRYSDWDAAYVLGSLSPGERREFERHLEECDSCSASVAELAGLPGLLSKVPTADAVHLVDSPLPDVAVPASLLPRLVRSAARRRRRARGLVGGALVAAAAAAAAIVLAIPLVFPQGGPSPEPVATKISLSQVVSSPLSASVRLVPQKWGTRIEMDCHYAKSAAGWGTGTASAYAMYVTDEGGTSVQVATWTAGPGSDVEPYGTTSLAPEQISSVDVRAVDSGTVLLVGRT